MVRHNVSLREILTESGRLAQRHFAMLAMLVVAIEAGYSVLDLFGTSGGSFAVNLVVSVLVQYLVIERLMSDRANAAPTADGRRYGSMFGAGILSGLGIIIGLLLLVVPGVYLAARWMMASQFVVAQRRGATEALGASWEATASSPGTYFLAVLVLALPLLPLIGIIFGAEFINEGEAPWVIAATNLLVGASSAVGWTVATAAYRVAIVDHGDLEEVFA